MCLGMIAGSHVCLCMLLQIMFIFHNLLLMGPSRHLACYQVCVCVRVCVYICMYIRMRMCVTVTKYVPYTVATPRLLSANQMVAGFPTYALQSPILKTGNACDCVVMCMPVHTCTHAC